MPLCSKSRPKFWASSSCLGFRSSFDEIRSKMSFLSLIKSGISRNYNCFSKTLMAVNWETFESWAGRAKAGYKSPKKSEACEFPEGPKARWASWEAGLALLGYVRLQNNERNTFSGCCSAVMLMGLQMLFLWNSNALISLLCLANFTITTSSISTMNVKQSNLSTSKTWIFSSTFTTAGGSSSSSCGWATWLWTKAEDCEIRNFCVYIVS